MVPTTLIGIDRLITVAHWSHESNPIVNGLGMIPWLLLTAVVVMTMLYLWYHTEVRESRVSVACVCFLSVLMGTVVVTNALYVSGLWPF